MANEVGDLYKICYSCKLEQPVQAETCLQCGRSSFAHNGQVDARKTYLQFQREIFESLPKVVVTEPEYKECQMCAEDIKIRAKKCKHCGSMQEL